MNNIGKRKVTRKKSAVIGIFTIWNLDFFDKPENVFRKRLLKNSTYPFTEVEPNLYYVTVPPSGIGLSVIICITTLIFTTIVYWDGDFTEYVVYPIVIFLGFLSNVCVSWQKRTIVIDSNSCCYEFYRGSDLIYRGHYHNIYIRLKGQNSGGGDTYFSIVLDGFNVDEIPITGKTINPDKMAKMARKLASKLDLNFFDYTDKSRQHTIRHRCPYASGLGHLTEEHMFRRHSVVISEHQMPTASSSLLNPEDMV